MVNKHYPVEFKADAVALYRSRPGASIASIADDLGVNRETLRSWVRLDDERRGVAGPRQTRPASFKRETLQGRQAFTDEREARLSSFRWLHRYNTVRRHSKLGQQSPINYENSIRPAPATLAPAA